MIILIFLTLFRINLVNVVGMILHVHVYVRVYTSVCVRACLNMRVYLS